MNALGYVLLGLGLIGIAVWAGWPFWVEYSARPQGRLAHTHVADGVFTAPVVALAGLWSVVEGCVHSPGLIFFVVAVAAMSAFCLGRRIYRIKKALSS